MRIGFVGTGTMGTPIAACLIAAGHSLTVYDRGPRRWRRWSGRARGRWTARSRRRARARWCSPRCPGRARSRRRARAADRAPRRAAPGWGLYRPDHQRAGDRSPASPRPAGRAGSSCSMRRSAAARRHDRDGRRPATPLSRKYRPLFEAIAANVFHVGPSGAGATAKLVTQYLGYTNFIASIEGMLVAAKAGIDLDTLARIVPVSAGQSRTFDNIAARRVSGHLRRRRHARHRRQGCRARLSARP